MLLKKINFFARRHSSLAIPSDGEGFLAKLGECRCNIKCELYCYIDNELSNDDFDFGSNQTCSDCSKLLEENKYKIKEFWDKYNGFTK